MAMIEAGQDVLLPGQWNDDDFDVLGNGSVVGRIFKANAATVGSPWMWTLAFGYHEDQRRRTAMLQRPRLPWQRLPRGGDGNEEKARRAFRARNA
jgi:hypothetical protein